MSCDDMIGEAFIFLFGVVISSIFVPGFHFIGSSMFFFFSKDLLSLERWDQSYFRYVKKTANKGFK